MLTRPVMFTPSQANLGVLKPCCHYHNSAIHAFMLTRPIMVTPSQANLVINYSTIHPFSLTRPVMFPSSLGNLAIITLPSCLHASKAHYSHTISSKPCYLYSTIHPFMLARPIMVTPSQANLGVLKPHLKPLSSYGPDLCIPCRHSHQSDQVTTRSIHANGLPSEQVIAHNFQHIRLDDCLLAWVPVTQQSVHQCLQPWT